MRAAVLEGVKRAVLIAGHHDGHRSEVRAAIGIGIGQLGFETEEIPGRPAKDARLLLLIDVAVRIDPIGYPGEPFRRPAASLRCNRHGILSSAPPSERTGAAMPVRSTAAWRVLWIYAGPTSHNIDYGSRSAEPELCNRRRRGAKFEPTRGSGDLPRRAPHRREDIMQPEQARPSVGIAPNNPVFDLPVIVGIEQALFAKAGLDVRFSASYADRERDNAQTPFMSRLKENLFDRGSADSYNVCEWASIDRLERGKRGGNIAALRAAVAAQAILTFDDTLQVPRDLADIPVLVQELTGSHYTAIQMLESAVGAEHVKIEHGGLPQARYAALKSGTA